MISKKGSIIAAFVALSLTFAANSFAMMGGGGGHGTFSNRNYSDDHYRNYNNNRSMDFEAEVEWYDREYANDGRGRVRGDQHMEHGGDYKYNQYDNRMGEEDPHYNSPNRGDYDLHHSGDGLDHHNY